MLRVDVLTIFPEVVDGYCEVSILGRARRDGRIEVRVHDLRFASQDPHRAVDDAPFGGGAGMVLAPAPVFASDEGTAQILNGRGQAVGVGHSHLAREHRH